MDSPKMSADLYADIFEEFGEETAGMAFDMVQNDICSEEDVKNFISRPDIDPDDWNKFEEGWRPDEW